MRWILNMRPRLKIYFSITKPKGTAFKFLTFFFISSDLSSILNLFYEVKIYIISLL